MKVLIGLLYLYDRVEYFHKCSVYGTHLSLSVTFTSSFSDVYQILFNDAEDEAKRRNVLVRILRNIPQCDAI